jgi:hypothetical protein
MESNANRAPVDVGLEAVVPVQLQHLSEAEKRLLRAAPKGGVAICGPNSDDNDTGNDPSKAANCGENCGWGPERAIRAEIIRWLCVDEVARKRVDPKGIQVYGAKITGKLDLSNIATPFPLVLARCRLTDDADLRWAQLPLLRLNGSYVHAITADGIEVKGVVALSGGFHAEGAVSLKYAQIGNILDCSGGIFSGHSEGALSADGIKVDGAVFLAQGFRAEGQVGLPDAKIGGTLVCDGGTFKNPKNIALYADRISVQGSVYLRKSRQENFQAEGVVRLPGAQIGGNLECFGGTFSEVIAQTSSIKGNFLWRDIKNPEVAKLNLSNASAGSIVDDEKSWPERGNLFLDGFVYGRFSGGATDACSRLKWLDRQDPFAPRPYRQLAKVLREAGDEDGAVKVLEEMERRRREKDTWPERFSGDILRWTIGYGYDPGWAIWGIALMSGVAWIIYRRGYLAGKMVPKEKDAYESFKSEGKSPGGYTPFAPFVYAVENSVPLVKLGQEDTWHPDSDAEPSPSHQKPWPSSLGRRRDWSRLRWVQRFLISGGLCPDPNLGNPLRPLQRLLVFCGLQPHPNADTPPSPFSRWLTSPRFLHWFLWIQILLGWVLATLFAAGVSGIIKSS